MAKQPRNIKAGKPRLRHRAHLEFCNLLAGSLVTELFGYPRPVRTLGLLECLFAHCRRKLINLYSCRSVMELGNNADALGSTCNVEVEVAELIDLIVVMRREPV